MTEEELQALLDSGNADDIDKALAYLAENQDNVEEDTESLRGEPGKQKRAEAEGTDVVTGSSPAEEEAIKGVSSKNGEHVLPYSVLESERQRNAQLQQELAERDRELQEARNQREQAEATQRKIELLQQQLEKNGIKPAQLAEELQLTEEELANLEDDYGDMGSVGAKTARKLIHLEQTVSKLLTQAETVKAKPAEQPDDLVAETQAAIAATDGLSDVMRDPVLSKKAIAIDDELKALPQFANKPLKDRFAEVMRRLTPVILNQGGKKTKQDVDLDDNAPPLSLNGIPGATADVNASLASQFEGLSDAEIQHRLLQLTESQQLQVMRELNLI